MRKARDIQKIMINLPVELLDKLDEYAASKYVNRTSAICFLIAQGLQSNAVLEGIASNKQAVELLNNAVADESEDSTIIRSTDRTIVI